MLKRVTIQAAYGLFLLVAGVNVVSAAAIGVSPVRATLSADQQMGALTGRNDGTEPVSMQLEVLNWSQEAGKDVLTPSRELLANPPILPCQLVARSWSGLGCGVRLMDSAS